MILPNQGECKSAPNSFAYIFYLATFFGLVAGLGEVAVFAFEKFVLLQYVHQSASILWIAPVANVLFFLGCGMLLWFLAKCLPRLMPTWLPVLVFSLICYINLLLLATWLAFIPMLVLALGLAVETTRLVQAHREKFKSLVKFGVGWSSLFKRKYKPTPQAAAQNPPASNRLSRRQFLVSTTAVLGGLTIGTRGTNLIEKMVALSELPPAPKNMPNVLLIVMDTVRAQSTSLYGYARKTTPNLARLANRGVLFDRALSTASWTLPSHSDMFTGHYPQELSADRKTPLDGTYPTLAEVLNDTGYTTMGMVANLEYCTTESGLARGFIEYDDYDLTPDRFLTAIAAGNFLSQRPTVHQLINNWNTPGRKSAAHVNDEFLHRLDNVGNRPFFAFLNYFDAHSPYYPPSPFDQTFGPITPRDGPLAEKWLHKRDVPPEELQAEFNAYEGSIAYIDAELGRLFDELDKRGTLKNTVVIITSDHGEEFGEHDMFNHGTSLYLPSLHVPLLIIYPGQVPSGARVSHVASLRDLTATITDLVNVDTDVTFPGTSLTRYWDNTANTKVDPAFSYLKYAGGFPDWFPISKGNIRSLANDDYHYLQNGDGSEELYNWSSDPWEQTNLATSQEGRAELANFRALVQSIAPK